MVEVGGVLIAPAVNGGDVCWSEVGVDFEHELFEGDSTVLVLIEEVVETGCDTFHVVIFLLAKGFDEVLDED